MRLFAPVLSLLVIAMAAACTEQGSSPLTTTGPSQVTDAGHRERRRLARPGLSQRRPRGRLRQCSSASRTSDRLSHRPPATISRRTRWTTWCPGPLSSTKAGTVTFNTFGVHQVAIYAPGTEPGDIDTTDLDSDACRLSEAGPCARCAAAHRRRHQSHRNLSRRRAALFCAR